MMVNFTAKDSGYFRVYVDGVEISKHLAEREALEALSNAVLASPTSDAYVDHDYRVEADMGTGENTGESTGCSTGSEGSTQFLAPPTSFDANAGTIGQTSVPVVWVEPAKGGATEYLVKNDADDSTLATVPWPATGTVVPNLLSGTQYVLYVVTSDGAAVSAKSNTSTVTTAAAGLLDIVDSFPEGDGTLLNGQTTDGSTPRTWVGSTDFTINNGKISATAPSQRIGFDVGQADYLLTFNLTLPKDAVHMNRFFIMLHRVDDVNTMIVEVRNPVSGDPQLLVTREHANWSEDTINLTGVDLSVETNFTVKVNSSGSVEAWRTADPTTKASVVMQEANIIAADGFRILSTLEPVVTVGTTIDDIVFTDLPPAVAPTWVTSVPTQTVIEASSWSLNLNSLIADDGGDANITFNLASGAYPAGLALQTDGTFINTTTEVEPATGSFTVQATNGAGPAVSPAIPWAAQAAIVGQPAIFTRHITFEGLNIGDDGWGSPTTYDLVGSANNLGTGPSSCTIDNAHVHSGTRSCKLFVPYTAGGLGPVSLGRGPGFWLTGVPQEQLTTGTELWYQMRIYFDNSWHETGGDTSQKFVRMSETGGASGGTFNDLRLKQKLDTCTGNSNSMHTANHILGIGPNGGLTANWYSSTHPSNGDEILNQWNTYEWYIKIGHDRASSEMMVYRDHIPMDGTMFEFTGTNPSTLCTDTGKVLPLRTLASIGDVLTGYCINFGQWNSLDGTNTGGLPINNDVSIWIDDIVTCVNGDGYSDTPAKVNPHTNRPYIGDWENP